MDADVVVVGGGPAGLAAAIALGRQGIQTQLLDRGPLPQQRKVCGEGLMPSGLEVLARLGARARLPEDAVHPFQGIRYLSREGRIATGRFRGGPGLGIRRDVLSRALLEEAHSLAPVDLRPEVSLLDVQLSSDRVELQTSHGPLRARFLVGADGLLSRVRSQVGLAGPRGRRRRFGTNQHFAIAPWSPFVDVHWGDGVEAYITPVAPDQVGVAMLWDTWRGPPRPAGSAIMRTLLARFPVLDERLRDAKPIDTAASVGSLAQGTSGVVRDRVALLGDAAGYLDAITGEGLSLALEEAVALGEILPALLASDRLGAADLAPYTRAHHRITAPYYRFTGLVLAIGRSPWLVERLVGMLGRHEGLFTSFLDVNMGRAGLASLGPTGWARVIWTFCFPPPHRPGRVVRAMDRPD